MTVSFKQFASLYDLSPEELTEARLDEIFGMFKNTGAAQKAIADRKQRDEDEAAQAVKRKMTVPQYREFLKKEIQRTNANIKAPIDKFNPRQQQAIDRGNEFSTKFKFEELED
jgi:hypothetical protein